MMELILLVFRALQLLFAIIILGLTGHRECYLYHHQPCFLSPCLLPSSPISLVISPRNETDKGATADHLLL